MSSPEQKLLPAPVRTTARSSLLAASVSPAAASASSISASIALCFSGRVSVTTATRPSCSTLTRILGRGQLLGGGDTVAHPHASGFEHAAVHAKGQRLRRLDLAAVAAQQVECRQRHQAGLGGAACDQTAAAVPVEAEPRVADAQAAPEPVILGVGGDAVDLDRHPKAPRVDALNPRLLGER